MAQNDILVYKFDELKSCSSRMGDVASALRDIKDVSERVKSGVTDYWQGKASDAFIKRFGEMNAAVGSLYSQVSKSKEKLDKAIDLETQNEESLTKNTVGRLSPENIF